VAAGLPALRNDDVHTSADCAPGFLGAADRMHQERSGVMHLLDVAAGVAEEERHAAQAGSKRLIDSMVLIGAEHEVAGKRPVGECCRFTDHNPCVLRPRQPQAAEAAGI
jgi:hypothetical protein